MDTGGAAIVVAQAATSGGREPVGHGTATTGSWRQRGAFDEAGLPEQQQAVLDLARVQGGEADLEHLRTQVQLLDLYWIRVVDVPIEGRGPRESVLSRAGRLAVSERRMSFPRTDLDAVDAVATADLLGRGVFVEGEAQLGTGRLIRFLHALVGDYAIARLLIRDTNTAEALLVDDPVNALFLRPSLELWLTRLWHSQPTRQAFWDVAIHLAERTGVPEIAKLIAPTLAADLWRDLVELEGLLTALATPRREGTLTVVRHLIACLTTTPCPPLAGSEASPWASLAAQLAGSLAADIVFPARLLVTLLSDRAGDLTSPQMAATGQAARGLLAWLWKNDHPDLFSAGLAIRAVCQTLASNPTEATALLRLGLRRRHVERRGYGELRYYGERIADLEQSPGLVIALYTAAFRFEDGDGSEPTMLRAGPVLPLVSNRQQEFHSARYVLSEAFRGIAERRPEVATEVLLRMLRASPDLRSRWSTPRPYRRFTVDGLECRVRDEQSAHSVGWLMDHGEEATMIAAWSTALVDMAGRTDQHLPDVIAAFLASNRTYAGWRVLIDAGEREDRLLDLVVHLVTDAPAVLSASTLGPSLCRLAVAASGRSEPALQLRAAFASLDEPTRSSLTACLSGAVDSSAEHEEAIYLEANPAVQQAPAGPEATSVRQILAEWCETPEDTLPPADERVRAAFADFTRSLPKHDPNTDEDWALASRAAARLASVNTDCSTDDTKLVATVLLRVLASARSRDDSWDDDEDIASVPAHWCVIHAVVGVARLYASGRCEGLVSASVIESIAGHDLPWARWQLARTAVLFVQRDAELAWSILEQLATDPVARVAADAVWMAARSRHQSPTNAHQILDRVASQTTPSKLVGEAVLALAGFLVVDGFEEPDRFRSLLAEGARITNVGALIHTLRPLITPPGNRDDSVAVKHRRVLQLLHEVSTLAASRLEDARRDSESGGEVDGERARGAALVLDSVITAVYFASGAHRPQDGEPRATREQMTVLFDEILTDLRGLLPHLPAPAIHHVVEIAAANAETRPKEAFLLIGDAVRAARAVAYETDSLAKDLVLGIARTYMTDHTELFQGATESARAMQAALVTILDSFVSVGWPDARAMAYRLHEVLR